MLLGGIKIVCQCLFYFYSATKQAEGFKDIFCSAVSEGSTQDGKEKSMFQGCVTVGFFLVLLVSL